MAQLGRPGITPQDRAELWRRWRAGEPLCVIARALQKNRVSLHDILRRYGGIAPTMRRRAQRALSAAEREEISRGLAAGQSERSIATQLKRAPSTVSREIARNGGQAQYRAADADDRAWGRARRPKKCLLATSHRLRSIVVSKLELQWSPQQIAGWLKTQFPNDPTMHVSHETIYRTLFVQAKGALKKELQRHLRSGRVMRQARTATRKGQTRYQIVGAVSIRERPAAIEDRSIPGHWEGDLLCGARNSFIGTLVERKSRYTMLVKLPCKEAPVVAGALSRKIRKLPAELRRSITFDRGAEFAAHRTISVATDITVYFCDPKSPWQRGTNENTNRLLRQYFPDGTDLSQFSQAYLDRIARRLNERPRMTLRYQTPASTLSEALQ